MWGRTVQGRIQRMSLQRCGVVWENNFILCYRSVVIFTESWGWQDHHSHLCLSFNQVSGAIQDQPGSCEETVRGGVWGGERTVRTRGRGRDCLPSLLFKMMFALWHPATSIVISHNIMACLAPWPSGWPLIKWKKKLLIYTFPSETLPAFLLRVAVFSLPTLIFLFRLHDPSIGHWFPMCIH